MLSGLTRVREFIMDDAHIFVTEDQIGEEVERLLRLVQRVYGDFGLAPEMKLSTRPERVPGREGDVGPRRGRAEAGPGERRTGLHGQRGRRRVLRAEDRLRRHRRDRPEVAVRDDPARLPAAAAVRPEVHRRRQHRAPAGRDPPRDLRQLRALHRAADRALRGRVPAVVRPRAGGGPADCRPAPGVRRRRCGDRLAAAGLRVELDERQEKIGYKIREAQLQKVPYMLVVGDREAEQGAVSVRSRAGGDQGAQPVEEFIAAVLDEIAPKGPVDASRRFGRTGGPYRFRSLRSTS